MTSAHACKTFPLIPADLRKESRIHIEKVRDLIRKERLDGCLIAANTNIYYLTLRFFRGYVWIPAEGDPMFFVVRPNMYTGDNIERIRKVEQINDILTKRGDLKAGCRIGLEFGELSFSEIERIRNSFPEHRVADCTMLLKKARMIKTPWEIKRMRVDATLQGAVYAKVPDIYREGMTDVELQIDIETLLRRKGCLGFPRVSGRFMQINLGSVIAGDNADVPSPYDFTMGGAGTDPSLPVGADGMEIKVGTTVMIDMNGCFNGYQSDMTRTWSIGPVSKEAMKAHQCSRDILRELEKMGRPGCPVADLYRRAMEIVRDRNLERYFMGHCEKVSFIGHGVGIELNEIPVIMERSRDVLENGMILAIEPKFVIPGTGAVGVENTYLVTDNGLETLTDFPEDLTSLV